MKLLSIVQIILAGLLMLCAFCLAGATFIKDESLLSKIVTLIFIYISYQIFRQMRREFIDDYRKRVTKDFILEVR